MAGRPHPSMASARRMPRSSMSAPSSHAASAFRGRPRPRLRATTCPSSTNWPPQTPQGSARSKAPAKHASRRGHGEHRALAASTSDGLSANQRSGGWVWHGRSTARLEVLGDDVRRMLGVWVDTRSSFHHCALAQKRPGRMSMRTGTPRPVRELRCSDQQLTPGSPSRRPWMGSACDKHAPGAGRPRSVPRRRGPVAVEERSTGCPTKVSIVSIARASLRLSFTHNTHRL